MITELPKGCFRDTHFWKA